MMLIYSLQKWCIASLLEDRYIRLDMLDIYQPSPKRHILDTSKVEEFADDNFRFDENGTKFSKSVENTVGKEEIARYELFFLFPQCFQKTCTSNT